MDGEIDANAPLDYAEFQLIPSRNRFEACVCSGKEVEVVASGDLKQLVRHLPELKDLLSEGSSTDFKLQPPKNLDTSQWFTKTALLRFLHVVGSPDILNSINSIAQEITQLEEARKFHLSLYTKDQWDQSENGATESCNSNDMGPKLKDHVETLSSDSSKNKLLQAMDLRLSALRGELAAAFNQAAGATCSSKLVSDMEMLSQHFGASDLRNTLHKFAEQSQMGQTVDLQRDGKSRSTIDSRDDKVSESERNTRIAKPSHSDTPVKYGVSPAKVAELERQSSTESGESSCSSEDDQPSAERSRTLIRSASPRRSASPMRRIQIGRSGSHRAAALTIKSLNYFPPRDRTSSSYKDASANSSEEEGSEQPPRKSETNVRRMSVQDAISLFEGKQKDPTSDIQKRRATLDALAGANKSVLRRWSAGTEESPTQPLPERVCDSSVPTACNRLEGGDIPRGSSEAKPESEFVSGDNPVESAKVDADLATFEERISYSTGSGTDTLVTRRDENTNKLTASAEWNRQKEAELNEILLKMTKSKAARYQNMAPSTNRSQDVPREQRGGFHDQHKGNRDEKIRGETEGKQAEKDAQFRSMQQILDKSKAEMASVKVNEKGNKSSSGKTQSQKSLTLSAISRKESPKPAIAKKALPKASASPTVRKSWPTAPSPRVSSGISPAKIPSATSPSGTTPTRRKPQPTTSVPRSSPTVERPLQRPKNMKATQNDTRQSMKIVTEKQQPPATRTGKTTKTKAQTPSVKYSSTAVAAAKPSFYSKVTKKSSVVPLESKPFLRKGSGVGPGVGPVVVKTKVSSQPEETLKNSSNPVQTLENEAVTDPSDPVIQQQDEDLKALETHADLESETQLTSQQKFEDTVSSVEVTAEDDDSYVMTTEPGFRTEGEEESNISPAAWVEIEEHLDSPLFHDESTCEIAPAANDATVAMSSPRVRHSLSQMLLEENAEPDITEWGNAENPPAMIYQKEEPKGLKRLLKFARKSRADPNLNGWSSPSVFSEGEDDADESKAVSKKNADLRKAAFHADSYGQQKNSLSEGYGKNSAGPDVFSDQSSKSKFSAQSSSHKLQYHVSSAATTTKATRSFFSLSAFRGNKPNETKLR